MFSRYGNAIFMINLVKKNEKTRREMILEEEFFKAVKFVNIDLPCNNQLKYLNYDMKNNLKKDKEEFVEKVHSIAFSII